MAIAIAALAGNALARQAAAPKLVGKAAAGKSLFVTTCGVCHMLAPAKTVGTIGPNLTHVKLTEAKIIEAIEKGGSSIMTKAAAAKYATTMVGYASSFSTTKIDNIAAYVYTSTHG